MISLYERMLPDPAWPDPVCIELATSRRAVDRAVKRTQCRVCEVGIAA